jgi:hypothetical protein
LSNQQGHQGGLESPRNGEARPFEDRLNEVEREQAEAKRRDEEYKREQLALDRKLTRYNKWLIACAIASILVASGAGGISIFQAVVAKERADAAIKATSLMRRSMAATQSVTLKVGLDASSRDRSMELTVENTSPTITPKAFVAFSVVRQRLSDNAVIGTQAKIFHAFTPIKPGSVSRKLFVVENETEQDIKGFERLEQAAVVEGIVRYDNGFGEMIDHPFCLQVIANLDGHGKYNGRRPDTCDHITAVLRLREISKTEKNK